MPPPFDSGDSSHTYGFPNRVGQDRHIQNIIDHTNNDLFPRRNIEFPLLTPSRGVMDQGQLPNPLIGEQEDGQYLDDFDRQVLGRSQTETFASHLPHLPGSDHNSQRLSLPPGNNSGRPRRVLGDASQHFRPFMPRDPNYQSPFSRNPIHIDRLEPSPASQPIFDRDGAHRVGELQPRSQLFTPPFYNSNPTPPIGSSLSSSSPMNPSGSSPSLRLSLKKQAKVADRPPAPQKWAEKLRLDFNHAPRGPPIVNNTLLVDPRQALPDKFRATFPYELFNAVQSKCFPIVYGTNDNVVVSAPTGSGKTAILEMAICRLVASPGGENFKIVYQAPTKSLCSERARDWEKKFSHMNLRCVELTGDTSQAQASRVGGASIIVTTPEKWDSITRKWSDHRKLLEMIRLVLIDEVHILKDPRGATLEAVVSRMKTIGANVRFVALSATVPNIQDVAKWLGRDHANQQEPARFEAFGEELRPVKLQRYVYGYDGPANDFIFDKMLDGKLNLLLAKHSEQKPIMIFCFTRKSCEATARTLAEWWSTCRAEEKSWPAPSKRVPVISKDLQEIVRYGVAFHHAGLDVQDRAAVEQNFIHGQLHVICCTSTLAVGVNLPCHTVVLKGTCGYSDDRPQEYSDLEVIQMLGRAGRPQFDDKAVAIIMTKSGNVNRYNKMISGQETLESTLHRNLVEHLNSEIGLRTIQDIQTAKRWISGTFLSVRVRQAPSLYDLDNVRNAADADEKMEEWCERDVKLLQQTSLVTQNPPFNCTEYGHAMSRYMVQFETMRLLLSIPRGAKTEVMLTTLCKAIEFKDFRFKPDERALFRELNKSPFILYPIKETVTLTWHKISLMVQIHLGGVELPSDKEFTSLKRRVGIEKVTIFDRFNRLIRCVIDCKAFDGDGVGTRVALELARGVAAHSWENKPWQLSQIPGFGPVAVRKWVSHGVRTVLGLADKEFDEIERISVRNPPYGRNLLKSLESFPRLTMRVDLLGKGGLHSADKETISVTLKVNLGHSNVKDALPWKGKIPAVTFMVSTTDGNLACFWRGTLKSIKKSSGFDLKVPVVLSGPGQKISCYFSCEEIVGTEVVKTLVPDVPSEAFKDIKAQPARPQAATVNLLDDSFEDGDVADEDMLNILDSTEQNDEKDDNEEIGSVARFISVDSPEDDFPLIDDVLSQNIASSASEPTRMENGKWMCNHRCSNGAFTKSGKPCVHKCCHEGVEKYRLPSQQKRKIKPFSAEDGVRPDDSSLASSTATLQASKPFQGARRGITKGSRGSNIAVYSNNSDSADGLDHFASNRNNSNLGPSNSKRTHPFEAADSVTKHPSKRNKKPKNPTLGMNRLSNIEYIDLSTMDDDDKTKGPKPATKETSARKGLEKYLDLHEKVQGKTENDPLLTGGFRRAISNDPGSYLGEKPETFDKASATDVLRDGEELPDLEELIRFNELDNIDSSRNGNADETLYPGVAHAFTTVDELQKASERFNLPSTSDTAQEERSKSSSSALETATGHVKEPSSLPSAVDLSTVEETAMEETVRASPTLGKEEDRPPLFFESDPFQLSVNPANLSEPEVDQPEWLSEFDPELINSLRGCCNFVD
ncbi:hypothetical protein F4779DRAFT_637386 [Xylariaceae sp. FL0662B]|nr:hypothetical protein F4779DRAFT_637386 [Xylariaceae sp. FL0662B]